MKRKMTWNKIPRVKKVKEKPEVVFGCDECGVKFSISHQRTGNSVVCALSSGLVAEKINNKWVFFCSWKCAEKYESKHSV